MVTKARAPRRPRTAASPAVRAAKVHRTSYHHGDLPRAMVGEAVRLIQAEGIDALTLREVGARLGVSRSALYRHFSDKDALLAAVAAEGFRMLRAALRAAWAAAPAGPRRMDGMGLAYVRFAVAHPSHYRVMFGADRSRLEPSLTKTEESDDAFQALVDAIVAQQGEGFVRGDEPQRLALYIWAVVHGVAMLALDRQLPPEVDVEALAALANERLHTGISS